MRSDLLVAAGEASGDRIAGLLLRALAPHGVRAFGVGGPASRAAGLEVLASTESLGAMGLTDVARAAPALLRACSRLGRAISSATPRAALLVNFTELNQRLGRALRARGTRVLWCVAPQVWAWRRGRLSSLRGSFDRMAVILPFEEALWRGAGHDASYVGHPSWSPRLGEAARPPARSTLAVLPGSRAGEVRRLAEPLLLAARILLERGLVERGRVLVAPSLPPRERVGLEDLARRLDLEVALVDASEGAGRALRGCRLALCASGTASLEAAIEGAAPVVAYRMDPLAFALAGRLVKTPHIALPNVLLRRRAFPELLQRDVTPRAVAEAARGLLERADETARASAELREVLRPPSGRSFGETVSDLLLPWLASTAVG